jgi:hypothetical protein
VKKRAHRGLYGNKNRCPAVYTEETRPRAAREAFDFDDPAPLVPEKYTRAKARLGKQQNKVEEDLWLGRQKTNFCMITTRME